jgi:hypothetical protein
MSRHQQDVEKRLRLAIRVKILLKMLIYFTSTAPLRRILPCLASVHDVFQQSVKPAMVPGRKK